MPNLRIVDGQKLELFPNDVITEGTQTQLYVNGSSLYINYGGAQSPGLYIHDTYNNVDKIVANSNGVGIGIYPSYGLDVKGAIASRGPVTDSPGALYLIANNSGVNRVRYSGSAYFAIRDDVNGADRLYIRNDGNVGIGDTNPASKLAVNGTGSFNNTLTCTLNGTAIKATHTNTNYTSSLGFYSGGGNPFLGLHAEHSATANTLKNSGAGQRGFALIHFHNDTVYTMFNGVTTAGSDFSSPTYPVTFKPTAVGIFKTDPTVPLHVNGNTTIIGDLSVNNITLVTGRVIAPSADSTTALLIRTATGSNLMVFDTVNKTIGVGGGPGALPHLMFTNSMEKYASAMTGMQNVELGFGSGIPYAHGCRMAFGNGIGGNYCGIGGFVSSSGMALIMGVSTNYSQGINREAFVVGHDASLYQPSISTPNTLAGTLAAGGSLIAQTKYFYRVSGIDANGQESGGSGQFAITTDDTNLTVSLTWNTVPGASSYKVYRTTEIQYSNTSVGMFWTVGNGYLIGNPATNAFTDDGTVEPLAGQPPQFNLSKNICFGTPGANHYIRSGNLGIGNIAPAQKLDVTGNGVFSGYVQADSLNLSKTITAPGTTGNQTINKAMGRVNVAAAGTSITVTNSLVTANSIIMAVIASNDTTAEIKNVVPGAGSFTINLAAAATAETPISFLVVN